VNESEVDGGEAKERRGGGEWKLAGQLTRPPWFGRDSSHTSPSDLYNKMNPDCRLERSRRINLLFSAVPRSQLTVCSTTVCMRPDTVEPALLIGTSCILERRGCHCHPRMGRHCCCHPPHSPCPPCPRLHSHDAVRVSGRKYSPSQLRWSTVDCRRQTRH
jgi:hypothetical protein